MKWPWAVAAITAAVAAAVIIARQSGEDEPRAVTAAELSFNPPLSHAAVDYVRQGGAYIWGRNDCSSFVTSYLSHAGAPITGRLTTSLMAGPDVQGEGLTPVSEPRSGDVLNYRYWSRESRSAQGHCGVVVKRQNRVFVVHNSSGPGLVLQTLEGFYRMAESLGTKREEVRILRPSLAAPPERRLKTSS